MIVKPHKSEADICLIVEGSYPYVRGGVSSWVQDLILSQPQYTFSVVCIVSDDDGLESLYPPPPNLLNVMCYPLANMPERHVRLGRKQRKALQKIEQHIVALMNTEHVPDLRGLLPLIKDMGDAAGSYHLLDSPEAWELLVGTYSRLMPQNSFLDYFWSFRSMLQGFYAVMLMDIPKARLYHTITTGYAGLLGARCHMETGKPLLLTEHGIYTNERRVELLTTDWLDQGDYARNYTVNRERLELHDLWIGVFTNYSRICYEACSKIVTLYRGNQVFQRDDGANEEKMSIIPNGVDVELFSGIQRSRAGRPPAIAFIGRVVPIKDVKTFIRACGILKTMLPKFNAYILGPTEEDEDYFEECQEMIEHFELENDITFTGNVDIKEYLKKVDVIALTSISEAQPLVVLEAGAAGIPTVATRVGACSEMILGAEDEEPKLGDGGAIVPLSDPRATARALHKLLTDEAYYQSCSDAIRKRVARDYNKQDQQRRYQKLYATYVGKES